MKITPNRGLNVPEMGDRRHIIPISANFENLDTWDIFEIGDIKSTMRTDLPNNWLLCNSLLARKSVYPKLGALPSLTQATPSTKWTSYELPTGISIGFNSIAFSGTHWVGCLSDGSGRIYYRENLQTGTWVQVSGVTGVAKIAYENGHWIALTNTGLLYKVGSSPIGTWTSITIPGATSTQAVAWGNSYWVVVFNNTTVAACSSPGAPTSTWTNVVTGLSSANDIAFGDNYFVVVAAAAVRYKQSDPTSGNWNTAAFPTGVTALFITYRNRYWVINGSGGIATAYETPITWTRNTSGLENTSFAGRVQFYNNWWVGASWAMGYGGIFYRNASDPAGAWYKNNEPNLGIQSYESTAQDNTGLFVLGRNIAATDGFLLPTISGVAYSYIKAKERA